MASVHAGNILGLDSRGDMLLSYSADTCALWRLTASGAAVQVARERCLAAHDRAFAACALLEGGLLGTLFADGEW